MTEFETMTSEEITFGDDQFLAVARKRAISDEGDDEFISLSRGFITDDGDRRVQSNFKVPLDEDVVAFLCEQLPALQDD